MHDSMHGLFSWIRPSMFPLTNALTIYIFRYVFRYSRAGRAAAAVAAVPVTLSAVAPDLRAIPARSGRFGRKMGAMRPATLDIEQAAPEIALPRLATAARRPSRQGSTINPETRGARAARFSDGAQAIQ